MAGVTEALRRYLASCGEDIDAFDLHAIVPVNLRTARSIEGMAAVLGNEFGLVFLKLPIQGRDTARRLESLMFWVPHPGPTVGLGSVSSATLDA